MRGAIKLVRNYARILFTMNEKIRNFCIIAHIDHGKSTLSDRLIQFTQAVSDRDMKDQLLDSMDIERERGITIKMQAIRLEYTGKDGSPYLLNLIDTPGHVDFTYEVSRSLLACEGALLLVDAAQGIEAQSVANFYLALEHDLEIIPVINKVDLPNANPERVAEDIERVFGIPAQNCILASGKSGIGVEAILEAIVSTVPAPASTDDTNLKALIYDAHYDSYRGVISYVRIKSGRMWKGQKLKLMSNDKVVEVLECGVFTPNMTQRPSLENGEVGYLITSIKNVEEARVGDTITDAKSPALEPLPGYKEVKPMVFCGFFPTDTKRHADLQDALEKLKLNDASLQFLPESSVALGNGFRCGFLGLLHMEITQERIEREFGVEIVATSPNVTYEVTKTNGEYMLIENPSQYPNVTELSETREPFVGLAIITPNTFIGTVMTLAKEHRAEYKKTEIIDSERQQITFSIPLNELIMQFFDKLKSRTKGYASMDYWLEDYRPSALVKVNMLINGEPVDALSFISHKEKAAQIARKIAKKLKEIIPRQMYEVAIQGAIGGSIICRETIGAMRKNVTAKCYGGDISRKRKLLEKQKEGKKKMKQIGSVSVPPEAFLSILKLED